MTAIINSKIGESKGMPRIWIEGSKLAREGYEPGDRYDIDLSESKLNLIKSNNGHYIVSRRKRNGRISPLIDLNTNHLSKLFSYDERIEVLVNNGEIVVTAHLQEQALERRERRLKGKVRSGRPLSIASVFHGGGVMDRAIHAGLASSGIKSKLDIVIEREKKYLDASLNNNSVLWSKNSLIIESDIERVILDDRLKEMDILIGGIPCTGASRSGRSKNHLTLAEEHGSAGAIFFYFLNLVQHLNPSIVIFENVPEYQSTASMSVIRSVLKSLGYKLDELVFDGNEYGALEARRRLVCIATSNGIGKFDLSHVQPQREKEATIGCILETIAFNDKRWRFYDYLERKAKKDKESGKGFKRQIVTSESTRCGTIGRGYNKVRSTEPQIQHPTNPEKTRLLTPIEHARVKGIPEEIIAGLTVTTAQEILGQAVIFPVFSSVGNYVGQSLKDNLYEMTLDDYLRVLH